MAKKDDPRKIITKGNHLPAIHGHTDVTQAHWANKDKDPHGISQHERGAKLDDGKPDCSLLLMFGKALEAVAEVGTLGAKKYTRGGWQDVANGRERYTAALLRHLFKEHYEDYDPDLGIRHDAQVAWNALARLDLRIREEVDADFNES